jgi:hypothetical protein
MSYATITPREGEEHTPNTPAGPWAFPFDGGWHPILNPDGSARQFPVEVAQHAQSFFTQRKDGEERTLVDVEVHEGALLPFGAPAPEFKHPDGTVFKTMGELLTYTAEKAVAAAQRTPEPTPAPTPRPQPIPPARKG